MVLRLQPLPSDGSSLAEVKEGAERRRERTRSSKLERLFLHAYPCIAVSAGVSLLCWVAHLWLSGDPTTLVWAALLHASHALQFGLVRAFRAKGREALAEPVLWLRRYFGVLLMSSAALGVAPLLFLPEPNLMASIVLVLGMLVMAAAGAHAVSAHRIAIYHWLFPLLGPLIFLMLWQGSPIPIAVGLLTLAFMAMTLFFANAEYRLFVKELQTKLDNDALVRALRQQVVLVQEANREKSRFVASASHDLRQPMHALGLFAATLEKQLSGTPMQPTVTHMIRSIDALEESFSAMLDISKLDAGVIEPNLQSFPIRDLFRVLHMHCAGQAEELGLSLRFKPGGKIVMSDPHLLERVLGNLIHNAIRYTQDGGIVVVARTRPGWQAIEVWDTGIGMAEEELPRVFDEFYQVGNPGRDRGRGLGMGLAIVKRLVLLMGHTLEVASTPGRGTVFRVLIKNTELSEMNHLLVAADTVPSPIEFSRTLLLIDDEESIREGMRGLLESWGYQVLSAGTITDACLEVRRHAGVIDIVISDLRLANGEDGLDAIDRVRAVYGAPLPSLLITGDTSPDEVKRVHESGHRVMFKPVRTRDLHAVLKGVP